MKALNIAKYVLAGLIAGFSGIALAIPNAPTLVYPANNPTSPLSSPVTFKWYQSSLYRNPNYRIVISQTPPVNNTFSGFVDNYSGSYCKDNTCFTGTYKPYTNGSQTISYPKSLSCTGHTYYWKVRVNDDTGASSWSVTRSFKTTGSSDSCPSVSAYGQSIWNEANRAYNVGERWTYKGTALVDSVWTYCARFVRLVHNFYSAPYGTAIQMCQNYANKGKIRTTGTPTAGAAVCYKAVSSGTYNNGGAGHIGIANGSGQELGVLSISKGVYPRTSPTGVSGYYWGWISADDFKNYY